MISTPWVHNSAGTAKDTVTYSGTVPVARARAKARTTSARARAHTNGARATTTETRAATAGCAREVKRLTVQALMVPSKRYHRVAASLEGKDPRYGKCCTCGGDHFARDCPKGRGKGGFRALEAWETWEEPSQVEHARVLSSLREAPPKHTGPQRVLQELRKRFMTCADMNCNCKGGHQQIEGETRRLQDHKQKDSKENGSGGEEGWVSKKKEKILKQRKREQARRTPPQGWPTTRVPQSSLKLVKTIEPDYVKAVNAEDGWEEIEFAPSQ